MPDLLTMVVQAAEFAYDHRLFDFAFEWSVSSSGYIYGRVVVTSEGPDFPGNWSEDADTRYRYGVGV